SPSPPRRSCAMSCARRCSRMSAGCEKICALTISRRASAALGFHELPAAGDGQVQHLVRLRTIESFGAFGGPLDLDELSPGGAGDVHVDLRADVIGVIEVEPHFPVNHADAHSGE